MEKNKCSSCGEAPHKCSCKNKDFTKAVIEIDNPEQITLMRKVVIPASMGDDTTVPPVVGKYHNVLLYYEANSKSYLYSSDGIPTLLANGVTDYEQAVNLPQINGHTLIGDKTGDQLGLQDKLTAGDGIEIENDTISISDIEQYAHFFDTVAEMKSATNLVDGDYARTAGYWDIGDNGGSLYKIVDDGSLTDDGGSIINISNNLKAVLVYGNTLNVAQFGITSTHTDNQASMVAFVNSNNISDLEFNPIEYPYDTGFTITKNELSIHGNGCTIVPSSASGDLTIFRLTCNNVDIEGINIDGKNIPQDQWATASHADLTIRRCFYINSSNVNVKGVNIKNVWGEGIQVVNFNTVKISNCVMNKIGGGFYKTDSQGANDYFGDAFYFSGHNGDAEVIIENCIAVGYQETGDRSRGSRCGFVLENLGGYSPDSTTILIKNSELIRFNRALHIEAYHGAINITVDSCRILQDCSIRMFADVPTLFIKNTTLTQTAEGYNGTHGLRGFNFVYEDSVINIESGGSLGIAMECQKGRIIRTTINGIKNTQISNVQRLDIEDSILNFDNSTGYTLYNSLVYCRRCTFNNSTTTLKEFYDSGSSYKCDECIFNDIIPFAITMTISGRYRSDSNILYSTSDTPASNRLYNPNALGMFTVYVNNVLVSKPSICKVLDADKETNLYNNVTQATFSDSVTELPIIPDNMPATFLPNRNSRYILIIRGSGDSQNRYNSDLTKCYYTTLTYDKNGNASIGTITTVGSPASDGYALSFDTVNGTVTKATSYSQYVNRVIYWILPYDYKDRIASFNP